MTVLQYFHHIDQDVTLVLNSMGSPVTDWLWQVFSDRFVWIPFYALIFYFFVRRMGWKKALAAAAACALAFLACDQLGSLVKNSVQRLRPCWDMNMVGRGLRVLEAKGGQYGFYSSHAANTAAFALCSLKLFRAFAPPRRYRGYAWGVFVWVLMVGMSRVFVGKHFLGDVLTGFVVGIVIGYAVAELARFAAGRFSL